MPDFPKMQRQKWVTLPQALRWIMTREEPSPENRGTLPTFPDGDTSREDLFRHWIDLRLKLYGLDGFDPRRPWTPLTSSLTYKDDCWEHTGYLWIRCDRICRAGFDSIDWERGSLGHFFIGDHEDGSYPYFVDLRVRWDALHALTTEKKTSGTNEAGARKSSAVAQKEHEDVKRPAAQPKQSRQGGRYVWPDWPMMTALTAMVRDRDRYFWEKVGRDKKRERVASILGDEYKCIDGKPIPASSSFRDHAVAAVDVAVAFLEKSWLLERDAPLRWLPLVAALAIIIGEREPDSWKQSSESEKHGKIKLILEVLGCTDPDEIPISSGSEVIDEALIAVKRAREFYEKRAEKLPSQQS